MILNQVMLQFNFLQTLLVFLVGLTGLLTIALFFFLQRGDLLVQQVRFSGHALDLILLVHQLTLKDPE